MANLGEWGGGWGVDDSGDEDTEGQKVRMWCAIIRGVRVEPFHHFSRGSAFSTCVLYISVKECTIALDLDALYKSLQPATLKYASIVEHKCIDN